MADNQSVLSWMDGARVLLGPSSRLQLAVRRELIRRHIHVHGMYVRSNRTASSDFPTRGSEEEIHSWAAQHVTTRRSLRGIRPQFVSTNATAWDLAIHGSHRLRFPLMNQKMFDERNPKTYTLREVCLTIGLSRSWIDPYRYKIADLARERGSPQFSGGRFDFFGASIQTNADVNACRVAFPQLNAISAFAIFLGDVNLDTSDTFRHTSFAVGSARLGDSLAGIWRIMVRGVFQHSHTFSRESHPIRLLSDEYGRCGFGRVTEFHTANFPIVRNVGVGMIVGTSPTCDEPFLSLLSHVPVPIHGARMREQWPPVLANDATAPLTCDERILLMGGHRFWGNLKGKPKTR